MELKTSLVRCRRKAVRRDVDGSIGGIWRIMERIWRADSKYVRRVGRSVVGSELRKYWAAGHQSYGLGFSQPTAFYNFELALGIFGPRSRLVYFLAWTTRHGRYDFDLGILIMTG
jgi:hypothetical protein